MRMWMLPPEKLCNRHLLGEHVELHMLAGCLRPPGRNLGSVLGLAQKGFLELRALRDRHSAIAVEIGRRGFKHRSPLPDCDLHLLPPDVLESRVDPERSELDLCSRCLDCRERMGRKERSEG